MKFPTVIILWILALVLGVTAYFVKFHGGEEVMTRTKLAPGEQLFENLPIREIYSVTLTQGKQITHLIRHEGNVWGVQERENYPIDYELLRNLLGSLNALEVTQGYPTASEYFSRFGVSEVTSEEDTKLGYLGAIRVTMNGQDGSPIAETWLGKYSGTSRVGGRFIRITGDDSGVYTVAQTFPGVTADPKTWLGKAFLKIDQMQSIQLTAPADSGFTSWQLNRANSQAQFSLVGMAENEIMQLTSTNTLRNLFANSSFQDLLDEERSKELSIADEKFKRQATIVTFDGLTYQLEFWPHHPKPKDPDPDPRLPDPLPSYSLTIKVTSDISKSRTKAADEKPEDAKMLDEQFAQLQKLAGEKLKVAKELEGKIFQVNQSVIAPLQKKRSDFVKTPSKSGTPPRIAPHLPQIPLQP